MSAPRCAPRYAVGVLALASLLMPAAAQSAPGAVLDDQKISAFFGGFTGVIETLDGFGIAVAPLGDLDGDGVEDVAVGALGDDDGGPYSPGTGRGAVWILFLDTDGTVKSHQKISSTEGGFGVLLDDDDRFGWALGTPGDLDGDDVIDLAVGARWDDDGGINQGAVYVLFLNTDGTVKGQQKISATAGGFTGTLGPTDEFGASVTGLGDLDGDTVPDLAVGGTLDDDGGGDRGAVYVLFMNVDGTVKSHQKISATAGGFGGDLANGDTFGVSTAGLGDLDDDGVEDLAVGARWHDHGGTDRGAVYVLFLNTDGTVKSDVEIASGVGGFTGVLDDIDQFAAGLGALGDFDGDDVEDLAVGANHDGDGGSKQGAVWLLFLNADGTVKSHAKISETTGGFGGDLDPLDEFGIAVANLGDLDDDGVDDVVSGTVWDDDGAGTDVGAAYVLFLDAAIWIDLGFALAGTNGEPTLTGAGALVEGEPVAFVLSDALAFATAWLVAGFSAINAPFEGGVLVPSPDPPGLVVPLPTDAAGAFTVGGTWPAGVPSDFTLWVQYWIEDVGGPFGWSASNAVSATTP